MTAAYEVGSISLSWVYGFRIYFNHFCTAMVVREWAFSFLGRWGAMALSSSFWGG